MSEHECRATDHSRYVLMNATQQIINCTCYWMPRNISLSWLNNECSTSDHSPRVLMNAAQQFINATGHTRHTRWDGGRRCFLVANSGHRDKNYLTIRYGKVQINYRVRWRVQRMAGRVAEAASSGSRTSNPRPEEVETWTVDQVADYLVKVGTLHSYWNGNMAK